MMKAVIKPRPSRPAGACDFPARPSRNGLEQCVFWTPDTDTGTVHIGSGPMPGNNEPRYIADIHSPQHHQALEGLHLSYPTDMGRIHLIILSDLQHDQPISAIIPLDGVGMDRIEAVTRLWRSLHGHSTPLDRRITAQQRRRLKNMIRAVDGRTNDADYREIAEVIFGVERVAADPWKTSALRDAVLDLVKDGFAMIEGGYRKLLRHRRRS